jgi:putative transposase
VSNDNVTKLIQPEEFDDQLTEILRNGARALLAKAVEAEVTDFLGKHANLKTEDGHQRVVRHGHLPEREVMTGIGPVAIRQPRVRDRETAADDPDRIRFSPSIVPPYMRRSKSIETLLPILYLKGLSTGDFSEALAALLGKDAAGLSASAVGRLKDGWLDEYAAWQKRDLSAKRYVYIWACGNDVTVPRDVIISEAGFGPAWSMPSCRIETSEKGEAAARSSRSRSFGCRPSPRESANALS